jgi:hypothetical protein
MSEWMRMRRKKRETEEEYLYHLFSLPKRWLCVEIAHVVIVSRCRPAMSGHEDKGDSQTVQLGWCITTIQFPVSSQIRTAKIEVIVEFECDNTRGSNRLGGHIDANYTVGWLDADWASTEAVGKAVQGVHNSHRGRQDSWCLTGLKVGSRNSRACPKCLSVLLHTIAVRGGGVCSGSWAGKQFFVPDGSRLCRRTEHFRSLDPSRSSCIASSSMAQQTYLACIQREIGLGREAGISRDMRSEMTISNVCVHSTCCGKGKGVLEG